MRRLIMALLVLAGSPALALDLGRTGISLNPPTQGWKVEQHRDAAVEVWHLRAESWDRPPPSGLIAVTVSMLDGDPWPDPGAVRDAAAATLREGMLDDITAATPFALDAGRFQIAGEDAVGALPLGQAGPVPAHARLLVIRTGSGALLVTAFAIGPEADRFAGLFGPEGMLTAHGPGSEALNGTAPPAPPPAPAAAPVAAPPAAPVAPSASDPGLDALLKNMQGSFEGGN